MMDNIIEIRYEGDGSLKDGQKLSVLRYVNRVFAGQKDAIIASNTFIKITSEKGRLTNIEIIGTDAALNKIISSKIANSELPL